MLQSSAVDFARLQTRRQRLQRFLHLGLCRSRQLRAGHHGHRRQRRRRQDIGGAQQRCHLGQTAAELRQLGIKNRILVAARGIFHGGQHGMQLRQRKVASCTTHAVHHRQRGLPIAMVRQSLQLWHAVVLLIQKA